VREDVATRALLVDGDVTVNWRLVAGGRSGLRASSSAGGAALLADVIAYLNARSDGAIRTHRPFVRDDVAVDEPTVHHTWTSWRPSTERGDSGWRLDRHLGDTPASAPVPAAPATPSNGEAGRATVVVLDDAGLGFRDAPDRWPAAGDDAWLVLKTTAPVATGALWDHLCRRREAGSRLVVVLHVDDLRRDQVQVSRGISWERTAQDLAWELAHNPDLRSFAACAHVVVSFGAAGAVVSSRRGGITLVFDPALMEGEWEHEQPGGPALTAFVAHALADAGHVVDHARLCAAVTEGLTAERHVQRGGFELDANGRLAFPFERAAGALGRPDPCFSRAAVREPRQTFWTILEDAYPGSLDGVSLDVARRGPDAALGGVPRGRFGKFLTVDRREIEALRAIRSLIEEYCALGHADRPVSIAVFGPPGSGKSFGVAQVAASVLPGCIRKVEFNLSQFGSPEALLDALHQVRDVSLSGEIPLVFWDEFDTPLDGVPLGWLRYFLAPMQDGAFREGQIVHPIGRAVFVFAGGTAASMRDFGGDLTDEQQRSAKRPDFVSRLRGYLDVLGPNPYAAGGGGVDDGVGTDRFHRLRRAILFESLLRRKAPQLVHDTDGARVLDIDGGVLRAFLEVPRYLHGARSMEAIIDMSRLGGRRSFERSCLPSEAQLDLHVDGRRFLALVHKLDLSGDVLEQLAEAAHGLLRADLERRGYQRGPVADAASKVSPKLCAYAELAEADKEQNRANVRDIPNKLAAAGYVMVAARSEHVVAPFPPDVLERLTRDEHERWMAAKLENGWVHGAPTDEGAKRHEALVPWEELPESERAKDRMLVESIAAILGRCGYGVAPVPE